MVLVIVIFTCDTCRNKRVPLPLKAGLKSYQVGSLMEKVHLELFLGPLPRTEAGNEYILMMVDSFTKWVQCVPLPSQTAEMTGPVSRASSRSGSEITKHSPPIGVCPKVRLPSLTQK